MENQSMQAGDKPMHVEEKTSIMSKVFGKRGRPPKEKNESTGQIVDIMQSLAQGMESLKTELTKMKQELDMVKDKNAVYSFPVTPVKGSTSLGTPTPMAVNFLKAIPTDLERVANKVLGEKFTFECEALSDQPAFTFTVIVPSEYSPLQGREIDRRSKVIQNSAGVGGVEEWCILVKKNVLKFIGENISTKSL